MALGKENFIRLEDLPPSLYIQPNAPSQTVDSLPDGSLAAYEIVAIRNALAKSGNNRTRAARILKIGEATLYRKIKKYRI